MAGELSMHVKVTLNLEIDETQYPHLKQRDIRKIIKETAESGHVSDYIKDNARTELEEENSLKSNLSF